MKHVVVPEVATGEMIRAVEQVMLSEGFETVDQRIISRYQAAIAAAPDTGMIAVDKVKFEALKALSKDLINKFENCLITNGTDPEFAAIATNKYRQALKDMEG